MYNLSLREEAPFKAIFKLYLFVWNITLNVTFSQDGHLLKQKRCLNLIEKKFSLDFYIHYDDTCDSHFFMLRLVVIVGLFSLR